MKFTNVLTVFGKYVGFTLFGLMLFPQLAQADLVGYCENNPPKPPLQNWCVDEEPGTAGFQQPVWFAEGVGETAGCGQYMNCQLAQGGVYSTQCDIRNFS